ncbi:MAG: serine protease [Candidatus Saccharibacteria bacterium]|nr:serine protease [Candidatus Saccharibacteria bacterium]
MRKSKKSYHHEQKPRHARHRRDYAQRKKHHKPFRVRHVGLLLLAIFFGALSMFQLGVYFGKTQPRSSSTTGAHGTDKAESRVAAVRSSYGFSFAYDKELLEVYRETVEDHASETEGVEPISSITLRPHFKGSFLRDGAARLSVDVNEDQKEFTSARQAAPDSVSDSRVAVQLYPLAEEEGFQTELTDESETTLGGAEVIKRTYRYVPVNQSRLAPTYSVQWIGVQGDRAFNVHLRGLIGSATVPAAFDDVFNTLRIGSANVQGSVLGVDTVASGLWNNKAAAQTTDQYGIERVSPAVVKIYHATCGTLVAFDQKVGGQNCNFNTGSGFLVSSRGHVATNGHVVEYSAEDAFVSVLLSNPQTLSSFLTQVVGMSEQQVSSLRDRPTLLASLIAEIYELPKNAIQLQNESHTYFVALGDEPLEINGRAEISRLQNRLNSDSLVKAQMIGSDYSSKDLYVVSSGDEAGFSSSDVALLKAPVSDTPFIELFNGTVTQNMAVALLGFPGDADNLLTDNTALNTTVTNGSISAIRQSAGGRYTLYQSDADASSGNSGGPALTPDGQAFGLLTYRFKSETRQDAAKSYIRAIEDLRAVASDNDVNFTHDGSVQIDWEKGLDLYAQNQFSDALVEFKKVDEAFPAHRLADTYIANAEQAIAEGRDAGDTPLLAYIGGGAALIGLGAGVVLMVRHHGHHQRYKLSRQGKATHATFPQPHKAG